MHPGTAAPPLSAAQQRSFSIFSPLLEFHLEITPQDVPIHFRKPSERWPATGELTTGEPPSSLASPCFSPSSYRSSRCLPLQFASTDVGGHETDVQQAKEVIKRIDNRAPSKMTIDAGSFLISYIVEDGVIFLTLADRTYPRKLAFSYLTDVHKQFVEELSKEFGPSNFRSQLDTTAKPYAFLRFERHLQRLRREYVDPASKSNSTKLQGELGEIQHIMRKNINEVLDRGEKLEQVSRISSRLVNDSKQFKWGAKKLNMMEKWKRWMPYILVALFVIFLLWWRFF